MTRVDDNLHCPLCDGSRYAPFHQDKRSYYRCAICALVFVPPTQLLSPDEEKRRYDMHHNSPADAHYRAFLNRLFEPISKKLEPGSSGLDFGAGPGPTLSVMLEEAGHKMKIFDVFYSPDSSVFDVEYDFITASEVVEHLHQPKLELERLWGCLKASGWLGIMTKRVLDAEAFSTWHYKNDDTHVCFFSVETFQWLAEQWGATLTIAADDVVLLQKT